MRKQGCKAIIALVMGMLTLCFFSAVAWADTPSVKEVSTVAGENHVVYPQLEGLADAAIQQAINDDIVLRADIPAHLITLSTLREGGWGLKVEAVSFLKNNLFSVTLSAKGEMPNQREGQAYTALCYDLTTGKRVSLPELLTSPEEAIAWMEEKAVDTLSEELSGYLANSDITPLPMENFALDEDGITFYYPASQFSLHSGYSGACQFYYEEIADFLDFDGILANLELPPTDLSDAQIQQKIEGTLKTGRLPQIPVAIGQEMTDVVAKYRLLREPDQYPGGKYYQLEAPPFRQVLVLSDALTKGYENSKVLGLQSTRCDLFGIKAGETTQGRWREILGRPDDTLVFTEGLAYDYGIPVGESDFYTFGEYQLRLHADENGVLHSVRLSR